MKPIALIVVLALSAPAPAPAASADPEPAKKTARPATARTEPARVPPPAAVAEPAGAGRETKWAAPELPPPDQTEVLVGMPAAAASPAATRDGAAPKARVATPSSAKAAASPASRAESASHPWLASMRALAMREGEARVALAEGERVLRPGDRLGVDTVRTVSDGAIVLDRPAVPGKPGGAATVLVRFDARGQARVRIVYEQDPTPLQAPRVQ